MRDSRFKSICGVVRMRAADCRSQPMQSRLQRTVFSSINPRYGSRGAGIGADLGRRSRSPQRVQVLIGSFPLANCSRNRWATGPKKTSRNVFRFKSPIWPEPS